MTQEQVPQPGFELNRERWDLAQSELRELHRYYLEDTKKSVDLATDANKQISAFYERTMLLALGTIGISVSAVTSFASRFAVPGFHKYSTVAALSIAWLLLLVSAGMCRSIMLGTIGANKSILRQWNALVAHFHGTWFKITFVRLGSAVKGSVLAEGVPCDVGSSIADLANSGECDAMVKSFEELQASMAAQAESAVDQVRDQSRALYYIHFGLLILGLVAVYLVSMLK